MGLISAAGREDSRVNRSLPDAVLVCDSYAWCEGMEFDHRGNAGVPVQKDLIVQSGDACKRIGARLSSTVTLILSSGELKQGTIGIKEKAESTH